MIFAHGPWYTEWHHLPLIASGIASLVMWWRVRRGK